MPERIRRLAEQFLKDRAREAYRYRTGKVRRPDISALYEGAADLFRTEEPITRIQRELAGATGEEEKRHRFLLEFLVDGRVGWASAEDVEQRLVWIANASIELDDGSRLPIRSVPGALGEMASADQRRLLDRAWHSGVEDLEPVLQKAVEREHEIIRELGYGSFIEARELISGIDLRGLARSAEAFLVDTADLYQDLLATYLVDLAGVDPYDATRADLYRVRRGEPFREVFAREAIIGRLEGGLRDCGLDLRAGGNLSIESESSRAGQRTFHEAFDVPGRVVLVVGAEAGWLNHLRTLRSLGEALHLAYTDEDLPLEFRWMGDWSVSLGFGMAFARLVTSTEWLQSVYGLDAEQAAASRRFAGFMDLLTYRTWAGRLLYELELHGGGDIGGKADLFAERMTEATGFRHDRRGYLWNVEPALGVARKLRGAALETAITRYLVERFGPDWFRHPEAGASMGDLFASGRRFTSRQLAVQIESRPAQLDDLRQRFEADLG